MKEPSILSRRTTSSRRKHGVCVQNFSGYVTAGGLGGVNISVLRSEIIVFRWVGRRAPACGWTGSCFSKTKERKCQILAIISVKINSKSVLN